ncbi:hypothetical protein L209DRAFT_29376 [Thermothelomyces heterothallicus CBS 203.75]
MRGASLLLVGVKPRLKPVILYPPTPTPAQKLVSVPHPSLIIEFDDGSNPHHSPFPPGQHGFAASATAEPKSMLSARNRHWSVSSADICFRHLIRGGNHGQAASWPSPISWPSVKGWVFEATSLARRRPQSTLAI